jgi:hypothetical protein
MSAFSTLAIVLVDIVETAAPHYRAQDYHPEDQRMQAL